MIRKVENSREIAALFAGWQESFICSYLDGSMGCAWAVYEAAADERRQQDVLETKGARECVASSQSGKESAVAEQERCVSAFILLGDFCLLAGRPERLLLEKLRELHRGFLIVMPRTPAWNAYIETFATEEALEWRKSERFATKKPVCFGGDGRQDASGAACDRSLPEENEQSRIIGSTQTGEVRTSESAIVQAGAAFGFPEAQVNALEQMLAQGIAKLPQDCRLQRMDAALAEQALSEAWSCDLCSNFTDASDFVKRGIGFCIVRECGARDAASEAFAPEKERKRELLAGAASYSVFHGGIEVEIDTREDMQRRGFAKLCGAALILECLKNGCYPSWDAHTEISLHLAEQFGYTFSHSYETYEISL